jgi:UDP-N-acetylglucosamine 2-epimerase (non-hydrolysing)/GDP/UDP-N,N'-diacetylbacillosamine 2-epimerase (hydrolysing)
VINLLHCDPDVDFRLLVSGGHLVAGQGLTVRQIEADGFTVDEQVEMVLASDTPTGAAKSFALGMIGYAEALDRIRPDLLVVLGDRYEALAMAITAALRLVPIAHIGGGEVTMGSTDDSVRHAISKFSHLHFVATPEFRQRVIQLGESPDHVFVTGAPGLDTIREISLLEKSELATQLQAEIGCPLIAVTYHPATADPRSSTEGAAGLVTALETFPEATVVFTGTNVDHGGSAISSLIDRYVASHPQQARLLPSLGQSVYLSLVKHADLVVGNSSSAIVEAPFLHTATVNIGSRQDGRPRAESVVDCRESPVEIEQAIKRALTDAHRRRTQLCGSPYGDGQAAQRIVRVFKEADLGLLMKKEFAVVSDAILPSHFR